MDKKNAFNEVQGSFDNSDNPATTMKRKSRLRLRMRVSEKHFNKWLNQTSIHGIAHVFKGKSRFRRLIWVIIFLFAVVSCIAVVGFDIHKWASDPTTTTFSIESSHNGLPFPAVTVCNLNAVRKSYDSSQVVDLLNIIARSTSHFLVDSPFSIFNESCNATVEDFDENILAINITEAYMEGRHPKDEFIAYCGFASDGNIVRCEAELTPVLTSLGICYTFNNGYSNISERIIKRAGPMNGLNLILNINRLEYSTVTYGNVGVKVLVHPRDAFPLAEEKGIAIPPGLNAFLAVESIRSVDQTSESNCQEENKTSLSFFPNNPYTVSTCTVNDLYESYADVCGCTVANSHPIEGQYINIRNCTIADACCILKQSRSYSSISSNCPPLCHHVWYRVQSGYSQFPSLELAEDLAEFYENYSAIEIQSNLVSVNVYFDELQITRMTTEYAYIFANLLADMGGLLGLFIGASVISLLEVVVLMIDFLKSMLLNPKMKKVVAKMEKSIRLVDIADDAPSEEED